MILCLFARFDPIASLLLPQYCMPPANESKSFDARPERILLDQAYKSYKSQTTQKKEGSPFLLRQISFQLELDHSQVYHVLNTCFHSLF